MQELAEESSVALYNIIVAAFFAGIRGRGWRWRRCYGKKNYGILCQVLGDSLCSTPQIKREVGRKKSIIRRNDRGTLINMDRFLLSEQIELKRRRKETQTYLNKKQKTKTKTKNDCSKHLVALSIS